jgi:hypothetical protein
MKSHNGTVWEWIKLGKEAPWRIHRCVSALVLSDSNVTLAEPWADMGL